MYAVFLGLAVSVEDSKKFLQEILHSKTAARLSQSGLFFLGRKTSQVLVLKHILPV